MSEEDQPTAEELEREKREEQKEPVRKSKTKSREALRTVTDESC